MRVLLLATLLCGGCYFGAGARVGIGLAGPGRGHVTFGGEGEAALGPWRLAVGGAGGPSERGIGYTSIGFALPGSVLHGGYGTTTPAPVWSGTGGIAYGGSTAGHMFSAWGGGSVLLDDPEYRDGNAWACEQRRDALTFELGFRSFGRGIQLFAGPTLRHQAIACGPRM